MAGSITQAVNRIFFDGKLQRVVVTLTCTGAADDGSFPITGGAVINPVTLGTTGWYCYSVETNPGSTAPTDNYTIVINDADSCDMAAALLTANRDQANTEIVYLSQSAKGPPMILNNWAFTITGSSVQSAVIVARLVFIPNL